MVIHYIESTEETGEQQIEIVVDCINHWRYLSKKPYSYYYDIMNIKTVKWCVKHDCYVGFTYHFNPNKW